MNERNSNNCHHLVHVTTSGTYLPLPEVNCRDHTINFASTTRETCISAARYCVKLNA